MKRNRRHGEIDDTFTVLRQEHRKLSLRETLEGQILQAKNGLYELQEKRRELFRLNVTVTNTEIVMICDDYKFAYGNDYTYCSEHYYQDCDCRLQQMAFIGYKFPPGYKEYPFYIQSDDEIGTLNRFEFFLLQMGKALNFEKFRNEIKGDKP